MADIDIPTIVLSHKYRLRLTRQQHEAMDRILESQRQLYNAALEHRIGAWRRGVSISLFQQIKELTELRSDSEFGGYPVNLQRWTLQRLENAYSGFFARVKRGEKAGFPRFRGKGHWNSFGISEFKGVTLLCDRIRFKGLPGVLRLHLHRPIPEAKPLCCTFTRDHKGWYVCLQCRVPIAQTVRGSAEIGIDMGLKELCVLSTGESIPNPRHTKRAARELRRRQRALSRCKKGSKRHQKVQKQVVYCHTKIKNTRRTYLHQVSAKLVRENDLFAIENLNVAGLGRGKLAKSIYDAGWATLRTMLSYKAESAGKTVVAVDPKRTSQECSGCGSIVVKPLSERTHTCPDCGLVLDRDHNAAINILARGRSGSPDAKLVAVARVRPEISLSEKPEVRHYRKPLERISSPMG